MAWPSWTCSRHPGPTWVIPFTNGVSFIQDWIDQPEQNAGLLIKSPILETHAYNMLLRLHPSETAGSEPALTLYLDAPANPDADGIPDAWEEQYGGTNLFWTGGDYDGDGLSDDAERIAGTVPTNALSVFQITSLAGLTDKTMTFPGVSGRTYQVQWTTNLLGTNWWLLAGTSATVTADGEFSLTDTNETRQRFYRLGVDWE